MPTSRNDNFKLINDLAEVVSDVYKIKDDLGWKKANVYTLTTRKARTIDPQTLQATEVCFIC